jgi:hypothetical protein
MALDQVVRVRFTSWSQNYHARVRERGLWLTADLEDVGDGIERSVGVGAAAEGNIDVYGLAVTPDGDRSYSAMYERQTPATLESVLDTLRQNLTELRLADLRYTPRTSRG